jgi:hypothetical protein
MKSAVRKPTYISVYPLKALNLPEEEYQSELKLWAHTAGQSADDIRILPMVNPYREKDFIAKSENDNSEKQK